MDLEKAYDKVCRDKLWCVLDEYGVKGKLMRVICHYMKEVRPVLELVECCQAGFPSVRK